MPKLSEKYIAGFLDSDGCIAMQFPKNCSRPQMTLQWSQKTSQDEVLHLIQKEVGGSISVKSINGVDYSRLTICGRQAVNFLNRIKKNLVVKRHYANVCLDMANKPFTDIDAAKKYLKEERKRKSLPLPNFPPRKWLAGYFDGDGCISVTRITELGNANIVVHVASSSFDTEGLEILHKSFGGKIHDMAKGRCRQWVLALPPSKAKEFLGYFSKHSIVKKTQADLILECAAMGHYRDGNNIKTALKHLKAHQHRLSEPKPDMKAITSTVRDIEKRSRTDYATFSRDNRGRITGKSDYATVETSA